MKKCLFSLIITAILSTASYAAITADFSSSGSSAIPKGWELKEWKGKGEIIIENEDGMPFIRLKSSKNSFALHKELNFNIKEHPLITWKWKVSRLPDGADVRNRKADDQSAQLYIVFPKFPAMINSRLIGYIWETSAPAGSVITSKKNSNTKYIVLQSGKERLGEWVAEKRNVYADYKMLFNEEPPQVGKISIMIDSDDTKSSAESSFSAITFEKEPVMIAEAPKPAENAEGSSTGSANPASKEPPVFISDSRVNPEPGKNNKSDEIQTTKKSRLAAIKSRILPKTAPPKPLEPVTTAGGSLYIFLTAFILILIFAGAVIAVRKSKQPKKE